MTTTAQVSRDPFAETRTRALDAAHAAYSPDPLIPDSTPVLWEPLPPFRAATAMPLRVGTQRSITWHVSDMATGRKILALRDKPGPKGEPPVLTTAFEPRPLRWVRRHLGYAGALLDRHSAAGGPWMLKGAEHDAAVTIVGAPFRPEAVEERRALIRDTAERVLDDHLRRNRDILDVSVWANDVMFRLMAHALGAPAAQAADMGDTFREWMHGYNRSKSLAAMAYQPQVYRQLAKWIRHPPGPTGILAELHDARTVGLHLGHDKPATLADLVSLAFAGIAAATDTPGVGLTQATWFAASAHAMPYSEDEARAVMLESLRYHPPFTRPIARWEADYDLDHVLIARRGERVEVHLPAMNRDPAVWDHPHVWDALRSNLTQARPYGAGLHGCTGFYYGTEAGAIILPVLAPLRLRPVAGYPYVRQPGPLHRIEHLPMRVTAVR